MPCGAPKHKTALNATNIQNKHINIKIKCKPSYDSTPNDSSCTADENRQLKNLIAHDWFIYTELSLLSQLILRVHVSERRKLSKLSGKRATY